MFNIKKSFFIFTLLGSLFLQGCFVTQSDIGVLKTQIAALNKTLQDVQRTQSSVDQQMEDVTIQLTQSVDNIREFDHKLDSISTKLDNISAKLESSKNAGYQMPPGEVFSQAKAQYDAAQYDGAISGFNLYIKTAPNGQNIEDAYLLLAQSYFQKQDYQKAAVSAATLLDKHPKSRYTAAARIIYARGILPLGKNEEAANYLKSVMQDFPNTPEAAEAARLLQGIQ